jgi:pyrimidine operon attenuation protein / uracil phosphoribosyltransferase
VNHTDPFLDAAAIDRLLDQMLDDLQRLLQTRGITDPAMIGIHRGGVWLAERLHRRLALREPLGTLGITFYRDDFTRIGRHPEVHPSNLPFGVDDRHILLVDDVLQTGRTIRAAMNEIFDYGRPASITLLALVERDGRELPIQPDIVGIRPTLQRQQQIKLVGPGSEPAPLALVIQEPAVAPPQAP